MFEQLIGFVADAVDRFIARLPVVDMSWMASIVQAASEIVEFIVWAYNIFPPLRTAVLIVTAGFIVESLFVAWYWINWLIKKIPGVS